jgi:ABC-type transport system involved in cytochrome c biogenesis permease subunit
MPTSLSLVILSGILYLAAAAFYFGSLASPRARKLSQLYWFVARTVEYWKQYNGFVLPAVSAFEAIAFMAFLITLVYYITEQTNKARNYGGYVLIVPILSIAYLLMFLRDQSGARDLPPALKSYWLPVHINSVHHRRLLPFPPAPLQRAG